MADAVEKILFDHFYTGEPGQHEAIKAAAKMLVARQAASHGSAGGEPVGYVSPATLTALNDPYGAGPVVACAGYDTTIPLYVGVAQAVQGRVDLTDEVVDAALSEYWDLSPRSWNEAQRVGMRKAILSALGVFLPSADRGGK